MVAVDDSICECLTLVSLSDEPRFRELVTRVERNSKHCNNPEDRQFDFWLGKWEVQSPQGQVLGRNEVTSIQSGCILMENWKSAAGGQTGTSFSFYDSRDKKWHQLYYDNSGNSGAWPPLAGEFKDGKMVMNTLPDQTPVSRWTWYLIQPGKVSQRAEQSDDGGRTWHITWDSVYVKN